MRNGPFQPLADTDGPALCRRFCGRLRPGAGHPLPTGSAGGVTLCLTFCRGFAAGRPVTIRRPRHSGDRP